MDPVTLTIAAVAAGGKLFEGFAGGSSYDRQAAAASANAELLAGQAEIEKLGVDVAYAKGVFAEHRLRQKVTAVLAAQPGYYAAAGLAATAVSPLVAAAYTAAQGQADAEITQANTALEVAAVRVRVANTLVQASAERQKAVALNERAFSSRVAGVLGAGTAFLSAGRDAFGSLGSSDAGFYGGSPASNPLLRPY